MSDIPETPSTVSTVPQGRVEALAGRMICREGCMHRQCVEIRLAREVLHWRALFPTEGEAQDAAKALQLIARLRRAYYVDGGYDLDNPLDELDQFMADGTVIEG